MVRVIALWATVVLTVSVNAQNLRLVLPQNTSMPSQVLPYGVIIGPDLVSDGQFPIVHVAIYNKNGSELKRIQQRPDGAGTIYAMDTDGLSGGTYVVCASLLSESMEVVLEESCATLHIITRDTRSLHSFGPADLDTTEHAPAQQRREVCVSTSDTEILAFATSSEARRHVSSWYYAAPEVQDAQYDFTLRVDPGLVGGFPALLNCDTRVLHPVRNNGLVALPDETYSRNCQLIDMQTAEVRPTLRFVYPDPTWSEYDLEELELDESFSEIFEQAEKRALVNRIFRNELAEQPTMLFMDTTSLPDDRFILTDYLAFESLELFFKEVAGGVRIRTQGDDIALRLLNGDSKNWYAEEPVLLIDGQLQEDLSAMWDLNYSDCAEVRLYRTLNSIRGIFGPLGRNGILEVVTKSPGTAGLTTIPGLHPQISYDLNNVPTCPRKQQYFVLSNTSVRQQHRRRASSTQTTSVISYLNR